MGWLGGINRSGVRTKRLCSLPSADRAWLKISGRIPSKAVMCGRGEPTERSWAIGVYDYFVSRF